MRFVVDGMLGGLARWLRMLGQEVIYESKASDNALLTQAVRKEMVLLTRDEELYGRAQKRKIPALLVTGETEEERLAQVARTYSIPLKIDMARTKCPKCGATLREASKREVEDTVPPTSLNLYSEFWKCENRDCGKAYWMGSHWKQINRTMAASRTLAGQEA